MRIRARGRDGEAPERLWAPWRIGFLTKRAPARCIFCLARQTTHDRRHHVVARGAQVFALLNRYPYNNGHLLLAPYRHRATLGAITTAEWLELFEMAERLTKRLERLIAPHGFNVGLNIGAAAGAGIVGHLHLHLVPRWHRDTNFMPVLAGVKVISQSLDDLYDRLVIGRSGEVAAGMGSR